jgi:hypothetical protein
MIALSESPPEGNLNLFKPGFPLKPSITKLAMCSGIYGLLILKYDTFDYYSRKTVYSNPN